MAVTNHERVGKALELLKNGLGPFVEREIKTLPDETARTLMDQFAGDDRLFIDKPLPQWDVAALLKLMWDAWQLVFKRTLGHAERSLVSELRQYRNQWAHQQSFSGDDAYRVFDSACRLLTAISAPQSDEIERMKAELLRLRYDEQVRGKGVKVPEPPLKVRFQDLSNPGVR